MKVAVYGSLRKGHGNYKFYLKDEKFIGQFETPPVYSLVDLGAFPGLLKKGATSVVMEVFEVDENKLKDLDRLEGYYGIDNNNHYNRETINSPFGEVLTYFYNNKYTKEEDLSIVSSGDWTDHIKTKHIVS